MGDPNNHLNHQHTGDIMSDLPVFYLTTEECSTAASQTFPLVENDFSNDPFVNGNLPVLKSNTGIL